MHPATPYYLVWALLVYAWIANYLVRMALGALLPPIMSELGLFLTAVCVTAMGLLVHLRAASWLLVTFMLATSFFFWCAWGPAYAMLGDLFPASVLGKAFGLYNTVCFVGAIIGPVLTGYVRDVTGSFAIALAASGALCLVSVVTAFALGPPARLGSGRPLARH